MSANEFPGHTIAMSAGLDGPSLLSMQQYTSDELALRWEAVLLILYEDGSSSESPAAAATTTIAPSSTPAAASSTVVALGSYLPAVTIPSALLLQRPSLVHPGPMKPPPQAR
ncbi:MAG: hypothetical protein Q9184_002304 [Pyrenodesmia sp. 2 TL-2023]